MSRGWRRPFDECYKVDKSGCWLWLHGRMVGGYGLKWYEGKFQGAHRVSWQLFRGKIPKGLFVLHTCDVKQCVNPSHLFLGSAKDNIRDAIAKRRAPQAMPHAYCKNGHKRVAQNLYQCGHCKLCRVEVHA